MFDNVYLKNITRVLKDDGLSRTASESVLQTGTNVDAYCAVWRQTCLPSCCITLFPSAWSSAHRSPPPHSMEHDRHRGVQRSITWLQAARRGPARSCWAASIGTATAVTTRGSESVESRAKRDPDGSVVEGGEVGDSSQVAKTVHGVSSDSKTCCV